MELIRRRLKEEMEDERDAYVKDLAERDFMLEQTRQKYQGELQQLSEGMYGALITIQRLTQHSESRHLRDIISNIRQENHTVRTELDELQLRYDDELYASTSWKKDKERLSTKVLDLTAAYESSKAAQAEQQTQIVALLSQVRELRAVLDEAEAERAALRQARAQLETRLSEIAQGNLGGVDRLSSEGVVRELQLEREDLKRRLEEQADRVAMANEKLKKAEGFASEYQSELSRMRTENSELEKKNVSILTYDKDNANMPIGRPYSKSPIMNSTFAWWNSRPSLILPILVPLPRVARKHVSKNSQSA